MCKMDATCNPKCSSESHSSSLLNLDKIAVSTSSSPCKHFLVRFRAFLDTDTSQQTDDSLEVDAFEDSGSLKDISCVSFSLESFRSGKLKDTPKV